MNQLTSEYTQTEVMIYWLPELAKQRILKTIYNLATTPSFFVDTRILQNMHGIICPHIIISIPCIIYATSY